MGVQQQQQQETQFTREDLDRFRVLVGFDIEGKYAALANLAYLLLADPKRDIVGEKWCHIRSQLNAALELEAKVLRLLDISNPPPHRATRTWFPLIDVDLSAMRSRPWCELTDVDQEEIRGEYPVWEPYQLSACRWYRSTRISPAAAAAEGGRP